jgi:hypothetical protein
MPEKEPFNKAAYKANLSKKSRNFVPKTGAGVLVEALTNEGKLLADTISYYL